MPYGKKPKIRKVKPRKVSLHVSIDQDLYQLIYRLSVHEKRSLSNMVNNSLRKAYRMETIEYEEVSEKEADAIIPPPIRKQIDKHKKNYTYRNNRPDRIQNTSDV